MFNNLAVSFPELPPAYKVKTLYNVKTVN